MTALGVHDPDSSGGAQWELATLRNLRGFKNAVANGSKQFGIVDKGEFNADKVYKDRKFCNVLFTREMQRWLNESGSNIKVFDITTTKLLKVGESTHWGGGAIEWMALGSKMGEKGWLYYSLAPGLSKYGDDLYGKQFGVSEISKEVQESDGEGDEILQGALSIVINE